MSSQHPSLRFTLFDICWTTVLRCRLFAFHTQPLRFFLRLSHFSCPEHKTLYNNSLQSWGSLNRRYPCAGNSRSYHSGVSHAHFLFVHYAYDTFVKLKGGYAQYARNYAIPFWPWWPPSIEHLNLQIVHAEDVNSSANDQHGAVSKHVDMLMQGLERVSTRRQEVKTSLNAHDESLSKVGLPQLVAELRQLEELHKMRDYISCMAKVSDLEYVSFSCTPCQSNCIVFFSQLHSFYTRLRKYNPFMCLV